MHYTIQCPLEPNEFFWRTITERFEMHLLKMAKLLLTWVPKWLHRVEPTYYLVISTRNRLFYFNHFIFCIQSLQRLEQLLTPLLQKRKWDLSWRMCSTVHSKWYNWDWIETIYLESKCFQPLHHNAPMWQAPQKSQSSNHSLPALALFWLFSFSVFHLECPFCP